MGKSAQEPTYTGIDKYPGIISTVVTVIILVIFVGGLYAKAGSSSDKSEGAEEATEQK